MKPKLFIAAVVGALLLAVPTTYALNRQATQLKIQKTKVNQLQLEIQTDKVKTQSQLKIKTDQQQQLEQEKADLQKQLQSRNAAKAATQVAVALVAPPAQASSALGGDGCPSDPKGYIYCHESGNNPTRWNSEGCVGLGQACPASKLQAVCPNLDYGCEDAWFSNYAVQRYGGWPQAQAYWEVHRNW